MSGAPAAAHGPSLAGAVARLLRRRPGALAGAAVLAAMTLIAILAPLLAAQDPNAISPLERLLPASGAHWFGSDQFGRDIFARVIHGARVSLIVGFGVALLSTAAGLAIGLFSGFVRAADGIVMRVIDGMMSIPPILLAIALMALTQGSIVNVIVAISISEVPRMARLVRGVVLSLRGLPYVEGAITAGACAPRIALVHILPNTLAPIVVQATYVFASAMIVEAILSFIGAGVPPSTPSWGNIMADGRTFWLVKPSMIFFPALFLSVTVLAVNILGDGIRDELDPGSRSR